MSSEIRIRGARQNNLKNLNLDITTGQLVVVTGVSGSGKSSLVFDTIYAEGQRRYVETFSPYARQFLDRMDRPQADSIEGIPPAIAIDQTAQVKTSRSTVGTMTELADHFKLLFARASHLHCRGCGQAVHRDTPERIVTALQSRTAAQDPRLTLTFPVTLPANFTEQEVTQLLEAQGYTRIHAREGATLHVVQDRFRMSNIERTRATEAIEAALRVGQGRMTVHPEDGAPWKFSTDLHCADCDIHYQDATPGTFSFNSPIGACETCRGFGRVVGIDFNLVVPDDRKTLAGGAIKPWQTESYRESQDDLEKMAKARGVALDIAWRDLPPEHREWVLEGDAHWKSWGKSWPGVWYGVRRFFDWLETKAYKMHIRMLLSKYRAYTLCPACHGARLKPDALLWRVGDPGINIHALMCQPISQTREFVRGLRLPAPLDEATEQLLTETRARLDYLCEVGLGYLTLDRQSRTLSGGEVQRINLTTALGTSLVNTLFVLDEPSIGLHPRDIDRINQVMKNLRDAGNTLLVVEHDPQVMLAADRLIDMGPGPGERGGEIVFDGTPDRLPTATTLTAAYLTGKRRIERVRASRGDSNLTLTVHGAAQHNLKHIDVSIPLQRLTCLTGVSGSGKSTLMNDVLHRALLQSFGQPTEAPGAHERLSGTEHIKQVVLVDQSPIGKSARSNPASFVGAFDLIRALFARAPLSVERQYTAGTFSFNSASKTGVGRCATCSGSGFEHVEMQFLSDVYLRCPDCDGRRYRGEVLEVTLAGKSIADVLEMTVSDALTFFAAHRKIVAALQPLVEVGLDYLRLGQPVPTLSGGEAQRLKLAGHLAERSDTTLFLFDEPTTGLHFEDIAKLIRAFEKLLEAAHTLVVIEHNLDVIGNADWLIDFGPEGGEAGGQILFAGTPDGLTRCAASHTGRALKGYDLSNTATLKAAQTLATYRLAKKPANAITVHHAREHNLKNIDVTIPREKFTVITGVSGSGKSTLAFDIIFNEGQRRYLESLNAYARQFVQPASHADVDAVHGIPPTVAIEQRVSRGGQKSTVATQTEIYHFLRLFYAKLGTQNCPTCRVPIEPQSAEQIVARLMRDARGQHIGLLAPLVVSRKGLYTDLAKWAAGRGATHLRVDGEYLPVKPWPRLDRFKEHDIDLPIADLTVSPENEAQLKSAVDEALAAGKGVLRALIPLDAQGHAPQALTFSTHRACHCCGKSFAEPDPRLFSFNSKHGWCEQCFGTGVSLPGFTEELTGDEAAWLEDTAAASPCPACEGERLNPTARAVLFDGQSIGTLSARSVGAARDYFGQLKLTGRAADIGRDLTAEILSRLKFLDEVGLAYLSLNRAAPTLSGGEAQRIRLASQLGSNLRGVCYVLDEPTIGLHPRDNRVLLDALEKLGRNGNTLVVVEHDEDTILRADHVIDLGPGAGSRGGQVVAAGTAIELMAIPASITGHMLANPLPHTGENRRDCAPAAKLELTDAHLHNLKHIDISIPLQRLTVITGVSGSGKSTLARDVLRASATQAINGATAFTGLQQLRGMDTIARVLEVDQTPIGKTPRSCPATYIGFFDAIRKLFAETVESRMRGYTASRFSFNTAGGRCSACEGQGMQTVEMNFLPDVKVLCESCRGQRFGPDTLAVQWRGKSMGDILAMSVDEALPFFAAHPAIHHALQLLQDVGLGYLTLGQPSPTLSGGEAQRIKLVTELAKARNPAAPRRGKPAGDTLYVLDEPTVGLHMSDVEKLIRVLHRLTDAGNTVVVVEHNLDVMMEADWLIDMGPEGGQAGGKVVVAGPPPAVMSAPDSHTGQALTAFMATRGTQSQKTWVANA